MTNGLQDKLTIAESFLGTAKFLGQTLGKLVVGGSPETVKARKDEQLFQGRVVCHYLYAAVFEIAIKVMWAIDKGEECPKTHDILSLYKELHSEKQSRITNLYDAQISALAIEGGKRNGSSVQVDRLVDFQSFEEALTSNYKTMTNFKYDGKFHGKSSAISGVIWNSNRIWILSEDYVTFPEKLLTYARENLESRTT